MAVKIRTLQHKAARLGILLCSAIPLAALCTWACASQPYPIAGSLLGILTWAVLLYSIWILRHLFGRLAFPVRLPAALVGLGRDRQTLYQAAMAIHWAQEDQAVALLEQLVSEKHPEVCETARTWQALAGIKCFRRRQRLPLGFQSHYPELFVLLFGAGDCQWVANRSRLEEELARIRSAELDDLARTYVSVIDFIVAARANRQAAFHSIAADMTDYLTGQPFVFFGTSRTSSWWAQARPILQRGGGPLLAGLRLVERGFWTEGTRLLARLEHDGLFSSECETIQRLARFLSSRPPWRLLPEEVASVFRTQFYCLWQEMGLLRLPLAEHTEISRCCRRGRELRESKQKFIGDLLNVWRVFGRPLDEPVSVALKQLTSHLGKRRPTRFAYWQRYWLQNERFFEPSVVLIMEGIAASTDGRNDEALRCFERAYRIDATSSTALVNQVYALAALKDTDGVREKSLEVLQRFPRDVGALMALGQVFAMRLRDHEMADKLFLRANQLCPDSADPLLLRAELALMEGHYAESEKFFSHALRTDPTSIEARLGLGRVHLETRRPDLAVQHLLSASQEGQGELRNQADYLLYRSFRDLNADRRAIEFLERIPTQFFGEPDELDDIAFHLETEQQYVKARVYAERAMLLRARGKGHQTRGGDELRPT
jgi:tetratricopeptide (TPR) repeat protein